MSKSQPKSTENIIFQTIKKSSPFKPYPKVSDLIPSQYKDSKVYLSKHHHNGSKLSIQNKNKQSKQRIRKVSFIQIESYINPQAVRKQQKSRLQAQNYKKQKQTQKVNKSIQQLKRKVDQLVDTFTMKQINNMSNSAMLNKLSNSSNFFIDKNNTSIVNFKDIKSHTKNQQQQQTTTERIIRYRHLQDAQKSSNLLRKNIFKDQQGDLKRQKISEKSFTVDKSKNILSIQSNKKRQNSQRLQNDQAFFTPVKSFSQKNIKKVNKDSNIFQKSQRLIKSRSQIFNNQSHQNKKQLKSTKSLLNSTSPSVKGLHQSLKNNSKMSQTSHYRNKWRHQNEIQILRHKLLGY